MDNFDVLVIGTGTAGQTAAYELIAEGYRVAIAESSATPGGVCALHGCQAKKYFYETMETVARSKHLLNKGITALPQTSWGQILAEKNKFTGNVPDSTIRGLKGHGVTYLPGAARFADPHTVEVDGRGIRARYFVIATGAKPRDLGLEGAELISTSNDFLQLERLPPRIGFIGGGFISFEFAHFAAHLGDPGIRIDILEASDRPLGPFDADMVDQLVQASRAEGIFIDTGVALSALERTASGIVIQRKNGDDIEVDLVVNGAGRQADIDSLGLAGAGVKYSPRGITVNGSMQSSAAHIFAVGDCAATLQLARVADMEAKTATAAIRALDDGEQPSQIDYAAAPAVLFTYPQLGMLGKTEQQLIDEDITYWKSYATNLSWPTYRRVGLRFAAYKILVDRDNLILGAHILSDNATGLINTFKQAMIDKMPVTELHRNNIMAPYPSRESDIIYMLSDFID
jgi:glutathione reductase (NADPH)